jgi:hypothetical protein
MTPKENIKEISCIHITDTVKRNRQRIQNRHQLRESQLYAMELLDILDNSTWNAYRVAKRLGISKSKVDEITRGQWVIGDRLKSELNQLIGING